MKSRVKIAHVFVVLFVILVVIQYTIIDTNESHFTLRGSDLEATIFVEGTINYRSNSWSVLKDLEINFIAVYGGPQ